MSTDRVTLTILDLGYGGSGALAVERALTLLKGVVNVYVNPATEIAYVQYDPSMLHPSDLVRAVEKAGFRAGEPVRR